MQFSKIVKVTAITGLCLSLAACGGRLGFGRAAADDDGGPVRSSATPPREEALETTSIWEVFRNPNDETTVSVNKYIWTASLEVLDFLPLQSVDPFTGVIVTGFGTPPGGGRAYRATVLIRDPALDARSLNVSLQRRGGSAAPAATTRAIEDAILTRARQLRISDNRL